MRAPELISGQRYLIANNDNYIRKVSKYDVRICQQALSVVEGVCTIAFWPRNSAMHLPLLFLVKTVHRWCDSLTHRRTQFTTYDFLCTGKLIRLHSYDIPYLKVHNESYRA